MARNPATRCDGFLRRDILRLGGLAALGLGLADAFRLRGNAEPGERRPVRARNCILIWLDGGPSHLETFDPKPDAPVEVRGPLDTIATEVAGVTLSECLPQLARQMNRVAVIRSMTSPLGEHNFGTQYMMTGYKPTPVLDYPTFPAVGCQVRRHSGVLPQNIAIPTFRVGGGRMTGAGFLSSAHAPFSVGGDPGRPNFQVRDLDFFQGVDLDRLSRRRQFVSRLDGFGRQAQRTDAAEEDPSFAQAFRLMTSGEAQQAFRLEDEPAEVRARYGGKTVGQSCLLARRLVERGVPFVTVNQRGWDTHNDLTTRLKDGFTGARKPVGLVPSLDLALTALMNDLDDRGLLNETLIVVMGEFGRTPKLNTSAGRDHWPRVFSALLAGAGIPGGQIIGASDRVGEGPADRPVTPSDLVASIYTLLGIDPAGELTTPDGRPVRLTPVGAEPLTELVG